MAGVYEFVQTKDFYNKWKIFLKGICIVQNSQNEFTYTNIPHYFLLFFLVVPGSLSFPYFDPGFFLTMFITERFFTELK